LRDISTTIGEFNCHIIEEIPTVPGVLPSGELQQINVAYRLNGKNDLKWSQLIRTIIKGRRKISHILGTRLKKGDPTYAAWDEEGSMIIAWL